MSTGRPYAAAIAAASTSVGTMSPAGVLTRSRARFTALAMALARFSAETLVASLASATCSATRSTGDLCADLLSTR